MTYSTAAGPTVEGTILTGVGVVCFAGTAIGFVGTATAPGGTALFPGIVTALPRTVCMGPVTRRGGAAGQPATCGQWRGLPGRGFVQ